MSNLSFNTCLCIHMYAYIHTYINVYKYIYIYIHMTKQIDISFAWQTKVLDGGAEDEQVELSGVVLESLHLSSLLFRTLYV